MDNWHKTISYWKKRLYQDPKPTSHFDCSSFSGLKNCKAQENLTPVERTFVDENPIESRLSLSILWATIGFLEQHQFVIVHPLSPEVVTYVRWGTEPAAKARLARRGGYGLWLCNGPHQEIRWPWVNACCILAEQWVWLWRPTHSPNRHRQLPALLCSHRKPTKIQGRV